MVLSGTLSENGRIGYPLYGSCLVCLVAEATLFALGLSQSGYFNTFVYFEVAFQACRILALVSLPTVLFITASTSTSNGKDEESAPLLGQDKVPDTTETSAANSTYGAISPACDGTEDSESDDEASYKKHDKKKIELQERLRAKGNWFT